jgi:hypothetical protein
MTEYVSSDLRRSVAARAESTCEYCLVHEDDTYFGCEVDHVISLKHGGSTTIDNLAFACFSCNRQKGTDIGSRSSADEFVRFFNPRTDRWSEHFRLDGVIIRPLTAIGEVTARILNFNSIERLLERQDLIDLKRYPSAAAIARTEK